MSDMNINIEYGVPQCYIPPKWAMKLGKIPKTRIKLAQLPTPIHPWSVPGLPSEFELYIKRDDLTGAALSGNKVRKLEFIFAEVLEEGCDTVVTGGGVQSNHSRATAIVAKELGIDCHLMLFSTTPTIKHQGNLLLDELVGASYELTSVERLLEKARNVTSKFTKEYSSKGAKSYLMEVGGANDTGFWGYIEAFNEMIEQGVLDNFDDIIVCMGTGGTAGSLAIANYLTGSKVKLHGITIAEMATSIVLYEFMDKEIANMGLLGGDGQPLKSDTLIDIYENHEPGYGQVVKEHLDLLTAISTQSGIVLDTTYTLKAVHGMLAKMKLHPEKFKGRRVLYLHSGGIFGISNDKLTETLLATHETNKIHTIEEFISV